MKIILVFSRMIKCLQILYYLFWYDIKDYSMEKM